MAENKTRQTAESVSAFLERIADPLTREDCQTLVRMMKSVTGEEAAMWGSSIVGFGNYHYKYESGREGDMPVIAFSPRKQALTLYLKGYLEQYTLELAALGKFKAGKGCLYIKQLKDVDPASLERLLIRACQSA